MTLTKEDIGAIKAAVVDGVKDDIKVAVKEELQPFKEHFDKRLTEMDQRLTGQITEMSRRITELDQRLTIQITDLKQTCTIQFREIDRRFTMVGQRLNDVTLRLDRIDQRMNHFDFRLDSRYSCPSKTHTFFLRIPTQKSLTKNFTTSAHDTNNRRRSFLIPPVKKATD